jgi:hypothetical protein
VLLRQADFFVYFMEGSTVFRQLNSPFEGRMRSLTAPLGREPPRRDAACWTSPPHASCSCPPRCASVPT